MLGENETFNLEIDGTKARYIRAALRLLENDMYENPGKYPSLMAKVKANPDKNQYDITHEEVEENIENVIWEINQKLH